MADWLIIHVLDYFYLLKRSVPTASAYGYNLIWFEFYFDIDVIIGELRQVCFLANSDQWALP